MEPNKCSADCIMSINYDHFHLVRLTGEYALTHIKEGLRLDIHK